jgi:hypothetical protein
MCPIFVKVLYKKKRKFEMIQYVSTVQKDSFPVLGNRSPNQQKAA